MYFVPLNVYEKHKGYILTPVGNNTFSYHIRIYMLCMVYNIYIYIHIMRRDWNRTAINLIEKKTIKKPFTFTFVFYKMFSIIETRLYNGEIYTTHNATI